MQIYDSEYNKKQRQFEEGINSIKRKNNYFFKNQIYKTTIYDLTDIKSYFEVTPTPASSLPMLEFNTKSPLPQEIENDIRELFARIWVAESL
ncbi:MAG: hypothetical protein JST70_12700 [Bacteroidetes bacterium]|nr:hypothetical protein [Bacteroidota bacterium]